MKVYKATIDGWFDQGIYGERPDEWEEESKLFLSLNKAKEYLDSKTDDELITICGGTAEPWYIVGSNSESDINKLITDWGCLYYRDLDIADDPDRVNSAWQAGVSLRITEQEVIE